MISSQAFKESSLGLQIEGRGNLHSGPGTEEQRPTWGGRKAERAAVLGAGGAVGGGQEQRPLGGASSSASPTAGPEASSPDLCILPAAANGRLIDLRLPVS